MLGSHAYSQRRWRTNDNHALHLPTKHHLSQVPRESAVRMQGLHVAVVHRPRSKGRRRTPLRDARAHDDEFHNAQTTGQKGRNVNDIKTKTITIMILLTLCECERDSITACGTQCRENGLAMKSYSSTNGCECVAKTPQGDGP